MERIREAGEGDLEPLAGLVAQAWPEDGWSRRSLAAALTAPGARARVAVDAADGLCGFVLARRVADLLEIDLVGVAVAWRRRGVARRLLVALLAEEASGLGEARLELAAGNAPARALYEGLGFVVVGRRSRYYPGGDDALLLSWPAPASTT